MDDINFDDMPPLEMRPEFLVRLDRSILCDNCRDMELDNMHNICENCMKEVDKRYRPIDPEKLCPDCEEEEACPINPADYEQYMTPGELALINRCCTKCQERYVPGTKFCFLTGCENPRIPNAAFCDEHVCGNCRKCGKEEANITKDMYPNVSDEDITIMCSSCNDCRKSIVASYCGECKNNKIRIIEQSDYEWHITLYEIKMISEYCPTCQDKYIENTKLCITYFCNKERITGTAFCQDHQSTSVLEGSSTDTYEGESCYECNARPVNITNVHDYGWYISKDEINLINECCTVCQQKYIQQSRICFASPCSTLRTFGLPFCDEHEHEVYDDYFLSENNET